MERKQKGDGIKRTEVEVMPLYCTEVHRDMMYMYYTEAHRDMMGVAYREE